ncbi:MAG: hypothetical protein IPO98_12465 [Saprospiraceae bacterium]|nr:hypothetical protein [Saprospiraceae bacterium]
MGGVSQFKSNVADGKFVATFENTNGGDGDGIKIKLGKKAAKNNVGFVSTHTNLERFIGIEDLNEIKKLFDNDRSNDEYAIFSLIEKGIGTAKEYENLLNAAKCRLAGVVTNLIFEKLNKGITFPKLNIFSGETLDLGTFYSGFLSWDDLPNVTLPPLVINEFTFNPKLSLPNLSDFVLSSCNNLLNVNTMNFPELKLNELVANALDNTNSFVTFTDNNDYTLGSVKAQSIRNWTDDYFDQLFLYEMITTFAGLDVTELGPELILATKTIANDYLNIGVEYSSGNGDYAEWLERIDPNEAISTGDIVAVKGGKITKDLTIAEQVMAVSHHPIVLGNIPPDGKTHLGNNIAFMGQIPVKIMGPVLSGDFIVAKSGIPGYGVAVTQADMTVDDFKLTVGRSWETNANSGQNDQYRHRGAQRRLLEHPEKIRTKV